jgi:uncharacterized lipoprotein YajG
MHHLPPRHLARVKRTMPLLLALLMLGGCARNYTITRNNGSQIGASSRPQLKDGVYVFKDIQGRPASIPAGSVRQIAPASIARESSPDFKSSSK